MKGGERENTHGPAAGAEETNAKAPQPPRRGPFGHGGPAAMMPGEKARDFKGTLKKLARYLRRYLPALAVCLGLAAVSAALAVAGPRILGRSIDGLYGGLMEALAGTDTDADGTVGINFAALLQILLFLGGIYALSALLQYAYSFILNTLANRVSYKMREEISAKINRLPLAYFDRVSHGSVLSRITNDVDALTQTMTQSLPQLISSLVSIVGALVMMLSISLWMTLAALLIIPLSALLVTAVVKRSQPYYKKQQEYLGEAGGLVEEMYGGHLVVKAFNRERESEKAFNAVNERLYAAAWKSQFLGGMMMPLMVFVGNLGYVAVCLLGGWATLSGAVSVGDIMAFIQYVRNFTQPIQQIANAGNVLQQTAAAAERVFEFLEEAEESEDPAEPVRDEGPGGVAFAHVNFGYLPGKSVISDFSAVVQPGRLVAIVGPTGAGKTTLVKLLMRFYDVDGGAVLVDGNDLRRFCRGDLRRKFGMVLQDTWLYSDTIMENIRYGRLSASDEEVVAAAKAAQADRFIRTLPGGYGMVLNEEAGNISAGQKQLLTIARTILADPKIMILDEATSSVDTRTEIAIKKAMSRMMRGRTSFVIAHRLSTIRDADIILVMREGDVAETGTHAELLAAGGFYAELYNSQFEGGTGEGRQGAGEKRDTIT